MRPSDAWRLRASSGYIAVFTVALLLLSRVIPTGVSSNGYEESPWLHPEQTSPTISRQPVHDVAVTGIQASRLLVQQEDRMDIDVTVQNLGSEMDTFDLTLFDDTDSQEISTISLSLEPGQALTIGFQWNTSTASPGLHLLSAFAALSGDQNVSNDSLTLASPIDIKGRQIILGDGTGLDLPDASFGAVLQEAAIITQRTASTNIFIGVHDASAGGPLARAAVTTQETPHQSIFVANADAVFQPSSSLHNPFGQGEVKGTIHLEGDSSSLGGYIRVGPKVHFVEADGSFRVLAPSGALDILIDAPGYVPVQVPNAQINPGEVLNLPELTLPFGDANGDGKIDILDLSIAASNFGETVVEVEAP